MPTRTVELVVVLVAPVPVGHRVEVCFLRRRVAGLFSNTLVEADHQPMITDLDSGVVYASELPWAPGDGLKQPDQPLPLRVGSGPAAEVKQRLVGRVRACRVLTLRGLSEVDEQTHLLIEVDA